MAHALASPRTSAHIIPLPGAALAPIPQQRSGPGRRPKTVVSQSQMDRLRYQRAQRQRAEAQRTADPLRLFEKRNPAQELEHAGNLLAAFTRLRAEALQHYRAVQQHIQAGAVHSGATLYQLPIRRVEARNA